MEKICEFCKYTHDIAACKQRGAKQRGKYTISSIDSCRPLPTELTRAQFRELATPLLDEEEYMDTMLYENQKLLGHPDGILIITDMQDSEYGKLIAEIEHGQSIGVLGIYEGTIRNVAIDKDHKSVLNQLIKVAVQQGARRFKDTFADSPT